MELISGGKYICHCGTCFCFSKEVIKNNVSDSCIQNVDSCMKVCKCSFSLVYALKLFFSLILQPTKNSAEETGCF